MPRPLLSEALRGHGALIRDAHGDRFVDELQPRDVVARAMTERMLAHGVDHVWLDATGLESFELRFPTIAASLRAVGLDPARDWLPIAPAAHYACGGVVTDLDGATALPGLWACAETACAGIHGANRLASNSLLDGMVFAPRILEAIARGKDSPEPTGAMRCVLGGWPSRTISVDLTRTGNSSDTPPNPGPEREKLQRAMTEGAGLLRSHDSLGRTAKELAGLADSVDPEIVNLVDVGAAIVAAALAREESRGCHTRSDFPDTDPAFQLRLVVS
jgi:L-aspartate oxidase